MDVSPLAAKQTPISRLFAADVFDEEFDKTH